MQSLVRDITAEGSPAQPAPTHTAGDGRASDSERCARPHAPQDPEEPVGLTLGAGSVGEACNRKKPAGGRPGKAGRFRATGCRVENLRLGADPARRATDKRPLLSGPSEAGRRSRGPEGETRRLLRRTASATAMPKASPPPNHFAKNKKKRRGCGAFHCQPETGAISTRRNGTWRRWEPLRRRRAAGRPGRR
jgi:hypothetical protein